MTPHGRMTSAGAKDRAPQRDGRGRASTRAQFELLIWRHGLCWIVAAALLALAAGMWWLGVRPLQHRLAAVEAQLRRPLVVSAPKASMQGEGDAPRLAAFKDLLQPYRDNPALVRRLVALTHDELKWDQAEFSPTHDAALDLVRLQITVPVSGEYRPLQQAVERALIELPNLSVDQLLFKRQQVGQAGVEARVRMSLWLRAPASGIGGAP
ncbi:hypothetical protein HLB44_19315 [Aquincola sp. S2]|uniref:Uncharacterized protein n=1 Tax=Pseudaquabacterium terrae TaxID=2732868 RepID=A0ABX2EKL8_9BURK|nr:hypothetical protein [Aquabacterium terrae]NRF69149.1 hypothetical protein [Aquabacterium terrae]